MNSGKVRRAKPRIEDVRRKYDLFEQRYSTDSQVYYYFNPYSGETLPEADPVTGAVDRTFSIWARADPPDADRDLVIDTMTSFPPQQYASRQWGRRPTRAFASPSAAANHIKCVYRGYQARRDLRMYYASKYVKVLDTDTGYYYFHDFNTDESLWYKPRLAFPDDVQLEDPFKYHTPASMNQKIYAKSTGILKFSEGPVCHERGGEPLPSPSKAFKGEGVEDVVPEDISQYKALVWPYLIVRSWFERYDSHIPTLQPFKQAADRRDWEEMVLLLRGAERQRLIASRQVSRSNTAGKATPQIRQDSRGMWSQGGGGLGLSSSRPTTKEGKGDPSSDPSSRPTSKGLGSDGIRGFIASSSRPGSRAAVMSMMNLSSSKDQGEWDVEAWFSGGGGEDGVGLVDGG